MLVVFVGTLVMGLAAYAATSRVRDAVTFAFVVLAVLGSIYAFAN